METAASCKIDMADPNRASDETSQEITRSTGFRFSGDRINSVPGKKLKDFGVAKLGSPTVT